VIRALERLLLVVGLGALAWYGTARIDAAREQAALSRELDSARAAAAAADRRTPAEKGSAPLATRSLIGRIEVPRLKLSALAREGVDVRTLRGSVGHVPGTALPGAVGNAAFAGHRDTFFAALKDIRQGDAVLVTTPDGVHRYSVTGTRIVEPTDVSVLSPSRGSTLTLVTCYPFDYIGSAPRRFIVQASLQPAP
jgi:sortase A